MDQLTQEIYTQLLELYAFDLEVELLSEKLRNISPPQDTPTPYPWDRNRTWPSPNTNPLDPWNTPFYYDTPYKVTCSTGPYPTEEFPYSEKYDAFYDRNKNEWIDSKCHDPNCCYCVGRPERPLP